MSTAPTSLGSRRLKDKLILSPSDAFGPPIERKVIACLLAQSSGLNVKEVHQCSGLWADGYLRLNDGNDVPFEIKSTLDFRSLSTAVVQVISLGYVKKLRMSEAWVIFTKLSPDWVKASPTAPLREPQYCLSEFKVGPPIKLVQYFEPCALKLAAGTPSAA